MDNDAAGSYDKIVLPHRNICCRRLGLPASAAKILAIVLNNTVSYLHTGHVVSVKTYCSTEVCRSLGTGQGSGASPCIWTAILDTMLWLIAQKYHLFSILNPLDRIAEKLGDAYVDNTALMYASQNDMNGNNKENSKEVTEQITRIAQDFEKKLFCTGGELALHKCYWCLINWKWEDNRVSQMATRAESKGGIILTKGYREEKVTIERLECTEAVRTTRVRIWPSGQHITEFKFRGGQARDFADKLRNGNLPRHQATRAYLSVFFPMISYSLGASTLTPTQLASIHSVVVEQAYLVKGGLNRKFPKAIIRGPRLYGGQGDSDLYTRKGYQQLQLFLGHIRNADTQVEMIRQDIEFLQLTTGIIDPY